MPHTTTTTKTPSTAPLHGENAAEQRKMKPQNVRLLKFLENKGSITQMEALNMLGIGRLASRVWELRNWHDVPIATKNVERINRYNEKVYVAQYVLQKNKLVLP